MAATHYVKGTCMLSWAVIFFIVAIVAGLFGFTGIAHESAHIGKIIAVIGIILAVISFVFARRPGKN